MSKILQSARLSFDKQKTIMRYFIPLAIIALIFTIVGDLMQKDLTYKELKKDTGKLVYTKISERHSNYSLGKPSANHIQIWIENQEKTSKFYVSIRKKEDAEVLMSKLIKGDTINVYTYSTSQNILKPRSRGLVLAIQHNDEDILSLAEAKNRSYGYLYFSLISIAVLVVAATLFWKVYVPRKTHKES